MKKLAAGAALTTLATLFAQGALAQSTASQVSEVVVTTRATQSTGGLAVATQVTKNQSIVNQDFIKNQVGSVNAAQLINMLPGVSYSTSDPTGVLSDDFRVHGFDGNHVSWTIDGTPVNDTGNYATFPGEYLTTEVTDRVTVNIGSTEVDSPSASAIGGTVNIVTKTPPRTFGGQFSIGGGSYNYFRGYGEIDTGEIGPYGTRMFVSANGVRANSWQTGGGPIDRQGVDFRIYQPLKDRDFISVAGTYNSNRPYFYESSTLAQIATYGRNVGWNPTWAVPTARTGVADGIGGPTAQSAAFPQGPDSGQGTYALHLNPVDFGDIRVQSRFDLSHGFTLTFDPYFFYTLANGSGNQSLKENDLRFAGNSGKPACVDLNGDGDCLDTVLVHSPNNTQTHRVGVSTSLLYDITPTQHLQFSYNLDYGNHRQTGVYSVIDQQTGFPQNPFGGMRGQVLNTQDANSNFPIRGRDRVSVAALNQVSFNYIGRFIDDKLHINIGVRDPMLQRKLNQFCYTYNGTSQYCDTVDPTLVQNAYNAGVAAGNTTALSTLLGISPTFNTVTKAPNFRFPFKQTYNYSKVLPNAGASFNFNPQNQVYFTYSQGFSAPRTDNLYSSSSQTVKPELTDNYGVGYRYQTRMLTASVNPWYSKWTNHIVTTFDREDPTISIDRNVGGVTLYGVDLELGVKPIDHFQVYASASFMKSKLENNYSVAAAAGPNKGAILDLPVKGKELVLTPDQAFSLRGEYTWNDLRLALQAKYTGRRFNTDANDQVIPGFTVADLDVTYTIPGSGGKTSFSVNGNNIFNTFYYSRSGTAAAATTQQLGNGNTFNGSTLFYFVGAPSTWYGTLKVKF
jgi:iron complex outermembrane receptor protein